MRLVWGARTERFYESGVDYGVLYTSDLLGFAWSGLISVTESPSGGEARPYYHDGVKYANIAAAEEFEAITKRKKEEAEIKNEARDLINKVTRWIKEELSGKVKREQLRSITNFAKELDDAINSRDVSNIKTKIDRLKNAVTKSL